ncbi:hypothetical protein RHMOL_Rhmol03G0244200 [Rhododendron molle]|uniref:Uncharacterized protein n=1 Tax=Rhododendron molle TaxID=49168 RepID=A0ACC0PIF8_RHOML|nr:hypothetical protein RHMOL_Rhmol03G0244200 [Rhododendron molle]
MNVSKRFGLLVFLFMVIAISQYPTSVEPRAAPTLLRQQRYNSKVLDTLGVVCDCCDGVEAGDRCSSSWEGRCTKLRCLPWKYHH